MLVESPTDVFVGEGPRHLPPTPPNEKQIPTPYTINDVLLNLVRQSPEEPLVGYPKSSHGVSDYVYYSAADIDRFTNGAVSVLNEAGLAACTESTENQVVAILGPSNLDYVVSLFTLSRMGYAVLLLSSRLSIEAYTSLLAKTNCMNILYFPTLEKTVQKIQREVKSLNTYTIPQQSVYSQCTNSSDLRCSDTPPEKAQKWAFIIHSSGSTGLPKPIFQTHRACISNYVGSKAYRALLTLPLFHNHGLSTMFRSLFNTRPISIYNANLPLTGKNVLETMKATQPESFHGVPYVLKLLSEVEGGVEELAKCQQVLFGGSSCPDDLGDLLVSRGVWLVSHYGATELGQLMTSERPRGDMAWNYVRPLKSVQAYIKMLPLEDGSYECVALDGLPAKVTSNSDDPPNSFHTRDTFLKHPTLPNAWKYLGRIDDRVTLVNGEKVLPIPIEHRIRQSIYVKDNLVFGVGRAIPGLIVVPSEECQGMDKEKILKLVWPDIAAANKKAEAFSQISRDMVVILDVDTQYPATDKGTMIRNRCYQEFKDLIEESYRRLEEGDSGSVEKRALDLAKLRPFLLHIFKNDLGVSLDETTDFFDAGIDSLQAIKTRSIIKNSLDLGTAELSHNVVFDCGNITKLAAHLHYLRTGEVHEEETETEAMASLIEKYSNFTSRPAQQETVLLTGSTGSLGVYVLSRLMQQENVQTIYCLVRASSASTALDRVLSSLAERSLPLRNVSKIVALPSQISSEDLGLASNIIKDIKETLTKVIHVAWAVNFTIGVRSFEQQHIKGVQNLINLCLSSNRPTPAEFYFCSSISAAAGTPLPARIAEAPIPQLEHAQNMGYARSKLVAERIIQAAAEKTGMVAKVLRVGQIVGDTVTGKWNPTEAIPLMLQTAVTMKALPALDESPSWLPVDVVADAILDLTKIKPDAHGKAEQFSHDSQVVYHVQNAKTFSWTEDLLPALRDAGLDFEVVNKREWVQRLRGDQQDPQKNPAVKLIDFFTDKYDNDNMGRSGLSFEMEKSEEASASLRGGVDLIQDGLIKKFVDSWRKNDW